MIPTSIISDRSQKLSSFGISGLILLVMVSCFQSPSIAPTDQDLAQQTNEEIRYGELTAQNKILRKQLLLTKQNLVDAEKREMKRSEEYEREIADLKRLNAALESRNKELEAGGALKSNKLVQERIAPEPSEAELNELVNPSKPKTVNLRSINALKKGETPTANSFKDKIVEESSAPIRQKSMTGAKGVYDRGYSLFVNKDYPGTIVAFTQFLRKFAEDEYADNALFWIGMSYWNSKQLGDANRTFRELLSKYPHKSPSLGSKASDATYMLGRIALERGEEDKAKFYFSYVLEKYPGSSSARLSRTELNQLDPRPTQ